MKVSGVKKSLDWSPSPGNTGVDALKALNESIAFVAMKLDGTILDLKAVVPHQARELQLIPSDSPEGVEVIRHGCAHIMAQAVQELFPGTQVTIGPVIENGFYYDFVREGGFKEDELPKIEARMKEIIDAKLPVRREDWEVSRAISHFKKIGEHYKVEIIEDLVRDQGVKTVSIYFQGDSWADLCRGPHIPTTGHVPAFKLMSVAGAYWRGDEKNAMLARVYGTAWASRDALKAYLYQIEEAKKRDHRKLGSELSLFSFHPEAPAAPFFHPSGAYVYVKVQEFLRELNKRAGFEDVISPLIMSQDLWKTSGHYDNYRENMYFTEVDERAFAVKPMNCPGHCLIFRTHKHSYRELPLRLAEFGRVHRHERSGVTAGLFRVRSFVQDDAHVFCRPDQIETEILNVLKMVKILYGVFGFEYQVELSTRPAKRMGDEKVWDQAEAALASALQAAGQNYKLNPGDGAFYGPKIDFHLRDSIGRTHQCGTVQLDFQMPERFGLEFTGSDNTAHKPVMIHRAIAGSLERFLGIYIEHVAGLFPMWLAPKQAAILTVSDDAKEYGQKLFDQMKSMGFRVLLDDSSDKLAGKIKHVQSLKLPYMIIVGGREAQSDQVSLRLRGGEQIQGLSRQDVLDRFSQESQTPHYVW